MYNTSNITQDSNAFRNVESYAATTMKLFLIVRGRALLPQGLIFKEKKPYVISTYSKEMKSIKITTVMKNLHFWAFG